MALWVALWRRLRNPERAAEGEMMIASQPDGSVERLPEGELSPAYPDAFDRTVGRKGPDEPLHPLCAAARNSSDPTWRGSFCASGEGQTGAVEDLPDPPNNCA